MVMEILQAIQTVAVLVGVVFGLVQLRQFRHERDVQAGAAMLQSLQQPDTGAAMLLLASLPDDLSGDELKARLGKDFDAVIALASMFESLGPSSPAATSPSTSMRTITAARPSSAGASCAVTSKSPASPAGPTSSSGSSG